MSVVEVVGLCCDGRKADPLLYVKNIGVIGREDAV